MVLEGSLVGGGVFFLPVVALVLVVVLVVLMFLLTLTLRGPW